MSPTSMKVRSRWIDEIEMIDTASFTLSRLVLTWASHSGSSGWPCTLIFDTKVS